MLRESSTRHSRRRRAKGVVICGALLLAAVWLKPDTTYDNESTYHEPSYGVSGFGLPLYVASGFGLPSYGVSAFGLPSHVASGFGLPSYVASGFGLPSYVASGFGSLSYVASGFSRTVFAQAAAKQALVETSAGTFVIDLAPDVAPNQTAYFTKIATEGGYEGTIFHRVLRYGMVQGGDPLTKDPARRALYGTGGLNAVKAEARAPKMTRGSVAAVTIPNRPDSAGAQFFIALADQPALDNQYTVFGHVSDGMDVLMKISETAADAAGLPAERIEIKRVTIRDTPPEPFISETPQELGRYRAVLDTSNGPITIEFFVDKAPNTVRQFMRMASAGVYNSMAFHRVAPGFVIQTGALSSRATPLTEKQQALVHNQPPEFNDTKHVKGIVSMARADAPDSATTSFFICTAPSVALDGQYTAFGRVVDGMAAVDAIEAAPRTGEAPNTRIELKTVRIERK
jgi:peptidyl-prolyl cis-trans isomerase B (cyclophilin B)